MYGFPLTIYLLSGWLQTRYPGLNLLSHDAGHLWWTLTGQKGDPHFGTLHVASLVAIGAGFWLLAAGKLLARALPSSTPARAGEQRALRAGSPSAVRRLCFDHVRISIAVADTSDVGDVSNFWCGCTSDWPSPRSGIRNEPLAKSGAITQHIRRDSSRTLVPTRGRTAQIHIRLPSRNRRNHL
jgi:hypothetical protein